MLFLRNWLLHNAWYVVCGMCAYVAAQDIAQFAIAIAVLLLHGHRAAKYHRINLTKLGFLLESFLSSAVFFSFFWVERERERDSSFFAYLSIILTIYSYIYNFSVILFCYLWIVLFICLCVIKYFQIFGIWIK